MPRASGLEAALKVKHADAEVKLVAGSHGIYDITVDGIEIFSKNKTGRFPENDEIIRLISG
ncbi:MAG: Rdx family protein [Proteobacteria bacterium]|nr:Rdx family protein [Pseudomonadota bacterium]MBU1715949.1 Rdx family protein [Pseudomonadota bacterium]